MRLALPTIRTTYVRGNQKATVSQDYSEIYDLDKETPAGWVRNAHGASEAAPCRSATALLTRCCGSQALRLPHAAAFTLDGSFLNGRAGRGSAGALR